MKTAQQQLADLFAGLDEGSQASLLAFAEFLASRNSAPPSAPERLPANVPEPENIGRPADESIVAALKRLAKTYPMLDKTEMLGATSDMVATHIMQGTDAALVPPVIRQLLQDLAQVAAERVPTLLRYLVPRQDTATSFLRVSLLPLVGEVCRYLRR